MSINVSLIEASGTLTHRFYDVNADGNRTVGPPCTHPRTMSIQVGHNGPYGPEGEERGGFVSITTDQNARERITLMVPLRAITKVVEDRLERSLSAAAPAGPVVTPDQPIGGVWLSTRGGNPRPTARRRLLPAIQREAVLAAARRPLVPSVPAVIPETPPRVPQVIAPIVPVAQVYEVVDLVSDSESEEEEGNREVPILPAQLALLRMRRARQTRQKRRRRDLGPFVYDFDSE